MVAEPVHAVNEQVESELFGVREREASFRQCECRTGADAFQLRRFDASWMFGSRWKYAQSDNAVVVAGA